MSITFTDLISAMQELQSQLISAISVNILFGNIVGTVSELTGFDRAVSFGRGSEHVGEAIEGEQRFWAIPYDVQSVVAGDCNSKTAKAIKLKGN
jgi:light-regulated signal transduction histidine kinase (bacteriophytochrome)